jgi:hypothetical protein
MKSVNELCNELASELIRLADCSTSPKMRELAKNDSESYVNAVEKHFLALIVNVADIKKAASLENQAKAA